MHAVACRRGIGGIASPLYYAGNGAVFKHRRCTVKKTPLPQIAAESGGVYPQPCGRLLAVRRGPVRRASGRTPKGNEPFVGWRYRYCWPGPTTNTVPHPFARGWARAISPPWAIRPRNAGGSTPARLYLQVTLYGYATPQAPVYRRNWVAAVSDGEMEIPRFALCDSLACPISLTGPHHAVQVLSLCPTSGERKRAF